jgi:hypothetical protein
MVHHIQGDFYYIQGDLLYTVRICIYSWRLMSGVGGRQPCPCKYLSCPWRQYHLHDRMHQDQRRQVTMHREYFTMAWERLNVSSETLRMSMDTFIMFSDTFSMSMENSSTSGVTFAISWSILPCLMIPSPWPWIHLPWCCYPAGKYTTIMYHLSCLMLII